MSQKWTSKWKIAFNVNKCKIMHLGYGNAKHEYELGSISLAETPAEKYLGF